LEFCSQKRGGSPKHVYLMDMNDLYLVAVRLSSWEFMAEASHINAKKAVRGLAADLQDFHEQGQRSSAAQLMQHGASAVGVAAIEDARQGPTREFMELEVQERRFELKRKAEDWDQSLRERQIILQKQKLEHVDHFIETTTRVNPDWRADARLAVQAQDLLCKAFSIEPRLVTAQGSAAPAADTRLQLHAKDLLCHTHIESRHTVKNPEHAQALDAPARDELQHRARAQRNATWRGKKCPHGRRPYRCRHCAGAGAASTARGDV
jgi:hypothetical protein